jgi:hypothetical protein
MRLVAWNLGRAAARPTRPAFDVGGLGLNVACVISTGDLDPQVSILHHMVPIPVGLFASGCSTSSSRAATAVFSARYTLQTNARPSTSRHIQGGG